MAGTSGRRLILLRHAKSAWPDVPDHERPLALRGERDAPAAGRWLRKSGCVPDLVLCSTARRARETWHLAEGKLGASPEVVFEQRVYGASSAELLDLARETSSGVSALMIVGHDPAMQSLALDLADAQAGEDAGALARVRDKFPTAAIAVLAFAGSWAGLGRGQARLAYFVAPGNFQDGHGRRR